MRSFYLPFILLLLMHLPLASSEAWIDSTIEYTINTKFEKAFLVIKHQLESNPDDYRAHFYFAATLNSRMTHFENQEDGILFERSIDSTIYLVEQHLISADTLTASRHAELLFYLASAYGYLAYFQGRSGMWIPALSNGIKANNLFNDAVEIDSTMYDAYLGIGTFKYWRYSKLAFISWLPFIPDDRDEGIDLIRKCISYHTRSQYLAMHQLTYILVDYGETEEAVELGQELVRRYPRSQFMWWAASRAYEKNEEYDQAVRSYKRLMELLETDPDVNPNHVVKCGLKLAEVYRLSGEYAQCYAVCEDLIDRIRTLDLSDKNDRLSSVTDLMDTCRDNLPESSR